MHRICIRMSAESFRNLTSTRAPGSGMPSWSSNPGAGVATRTRTALASHAATTLPPDDVNLTSAGAAFAGELVVDGTDEALVPGPRDSGAAPVEEFRRSTAETMT